LRQLVGTQLSEADLAELSAHLSDCHVCQGVLDQLLTCSGVWPVPPAAPEPVEPGPALAQVLGRLHGALPPLAGHSAAESSPEYESLGLTQETPEPPPVFDFLEPMDRPGYLGRLKGYEVTHILGFGGMGVVFKAFDPKLHRFVAIKVLAAHLANNANARRRFLREAQAAAAVCHEHVIAVHAVAEEPLPHLVMEYVAGASLQQRLDRTGPLKVAEILRIGMQTALGLAAAHAQGLVHRDVKPANILLENGVERVKITDFGLARAVDDSSLTRNGVIVGTPLYMAPEQARNEAVDHRADLFSLGSILYALATGKPPFQAPSSLAVLRRVCDDAPRPIRQVNADVPEWLCAIIAKLQAKRPAERYGSAQEVADLLGRHLAQLQQPDGVPARPRPRLWLPAALLAVVLGVAALLVADRLIPGGLFFPGPQDAGDGKGQQPPEGGAARRGPALKNPTRSALDQVPSGEVVLLPGGRRVLARVPGREKTVQVLELTGEKTWKEVFRLEGHDRDVTALAVTPDGRWAVTGSEDRTVRLWDLEKREARRTFQGHVTSVTAVAFFPKTRPDDPGKIFSAADDGTLRIWDAAADQEVIKFEPVKSRLEHVDAAVVWANATNVTTASAEGNIWVWDTRDSKKESRPYQLSPRSDILLGILLADGHHFVHTNRDHALILHEVRMSSGSEVKRFHGHNDVVTALTASPNQRYLLSGSADRSVRLWDVASGKEIGRFDDPDAAIARVAFAPDGKHLLAVNARGTVWLWDAPP
jgi:tRNA A-37 threonylcarbamoyl transferase component Bud32